DATFSEQVERASLPAVVDFWAEWCQPCQIIASYIEFLARDYAGRLVVASVDVDENPQTPQRFQVMGLPTLLLLYQGREIGRIVGVASYAEIQEQVERLLRQPNC
ncbi:MAG: thioredoxin family protein, partial [Caldilinea sp.]